MQHSIEPGLQRSLSLTLVTFYGIGTILGAGIYVLVGKVAGEAGMAAPLSFLIASLLAGFSAFSYAELSSRYPQSAGEAVYIQQAFGKQQLSMLMGFLIVAIGMVSTATLVHGFTGYLNVFFELPAILVQLLVISTLGIIVAWGIGQSVIIASVLTVLEIIGLLIILWVTRNNLLLAPASIETLLPVADSSIWIGVMAGAFVAFYAFVGFEDIVNVAEEVVQPQINLPRAIIISLVVTTVLYFLVSTASVMSVSPESLAQSDAPLVMIYEQQTGRPATVIALISVLSVLNGALVQVVMASRVLYGMSHQGWIPRFFGRVHPVSRTPVIATALVSGAILVLVLCLPILSLAKITSFITLLVFSLINLALLIIKLGGEKHHAFSVPVWVPLMGFAVCASFVSFQAYRYLFHQGG
ncbi:MAG: amino acid permease [Gammaproteobacteria bacterium]